MSTLELNGTLYTLDPDVSAMFGQLSPRGWQRVGDYLAFQPRVADTKLLPGLKPNRLVTGAALVHLIKRGQLPAKGAVAQYAGGPEDLRIAQLTFGTRAELARKTLSPAFDEDGGITKLPSGNFSARLYVPGVGLRRVKGPFATREEAKAARLAAYEELQSNPQAFAPAPAEPDKTDPEVLRADLDRALAQIAALQARVEALSPAPF